MYDSEMMTNQCVVDWAVFLQHHLMIKSQNSMRVVFLPTSLRAGVKRKSSTAKYDLSYDVAGIQWIKSCHKKSNDNTCNNIWTRTVDVTSLTTSVSTMRFLIEIKFSLNAKKSLFQNSNDQQNLTFVVISYEIYETRRSLVS